MILSDIKFNQAKIPNKLISNNYVCYNIIMNNNNKLSFVIFGNVKVAKANESPPIAKAVFMANCFPITLKPKNTKGKLTQIISTYNGISVSEAISNEIPVAPPSIK